MNDATASVTSVAASGSERVRAWDVFVRLFHWSVVTLVFLNMVVLDDESRAHVYVGYAVAGLVAARLVWGLIGSRNARFSAFPPSLSAARDHFAGMLAGRRDKPHVSHNPVGALMIYNLLATLALISVTGLMLRMDAFWGVGWVEEVHEALTGWLTISVLAHVAGVFVEQARSGVNLVRAMVTGWKNMPSDPK